MQSEECGADQAKRCRQEESRPIVSIVLRLFRSATLTVAHGWVKEANDKIAGRMGATSMAVRTPKAFYLGKIDPAQN